MTEFAGNGWLNLNFTFDHRRWSVASSEHKTPMSPKRGKPRRDRGNPCRKILDDPRSTARPSDRPSPGFVSIDSQNPAQPGPKPRRLSILSPREQGRDGRPNGRRRQTGASKECAFPSTAVQTSILGSEVETVSLCSLFAFSRRLI
jgi:hypothetical protein